MEINADFNLLKQNLAETIQKLQKKIKMSKTKSTFIVMYGALASGITTILIGLSTYSVFGKYTTYLTIAALIVSATLTIVQAWDGLFHHKRLWIIQSEVLNKFKNLSQDLSHIESTKQFDQGLINDCYKQYKEIYDTWNSEWSDMRNKD
jgi:amino acid transporter